MLILKEIYKMLKGNAIVGQSGGPTAAINATLAGVIRGAFDCPAIETIYGAFNGVEGMLAGTVCNLNEVFANRDDLRVLCATPAAALGSCRKKLPKLDDEAGRQHMRLLLSSSRSTISAISSTSAETIPWTPWQS